MTPQQIIAKWKKADLSERSAYQQHFLLVCCIHSIACRVHAVKKTKLA